MERKEIYIVLTDTGSFLTKTIKLYTKAPYNHASISFDPQLEQMYSFGRKQPNNPLIGGFVKENVHEGIFNGGNIKCAIYQCTVSEDQYKKMKKRVVEFERNQQQYKYNFIGLFGFIFNKGIERKHAFFCSQFVTTILQNGDVRPVDKPASLTSPQDLASSSTFKKIYEGKLYSYLHQNQSFSCNLLSNESFMHIRQTG